MPLKTSAINTGRNLFKKHAEYKQPTLENAKAYRAEDVQTATITYNGHRYNADEDSMNRLDRVVDVANWKYNKAVASGLSSADAYKSVYIGTSISWKSADNDWVTLTIEQLCEIQEFALNNLESIWNRYG